MSISSRISSMEEHVTNAYNGLQGLGADLTNVNKNIENISMVLDDIYDSMPQVSGEGTSLTLDDTRVGKIKSTLKGNTSQTGTPTPTSPIPVNVVSGDNEINVCGKNIFDGVIEQGSYDISTGAKTGSDVFYRNANKIPVSPSTTYTFSINGVSQRYVVLFYQANGTFISQNAGLTTGTFTTPNSAYYINFRCFQSDYTSDYATLKVQLEKNSSATTYEAFNGNTYNIDLPVENLLDESSLELGSIDASTGQNTFKQNEFRTSGYISVQGGNTYTLSNYNYSSYTYRGIFEYDENHTYIKRTNNTVISTSQSFSLTLGSTTKYVRVRYIANSDIPDVPTNMQMQYEYGSKANTYTPYGTTPIELCSSQDGTKRDYLLHDKTLDKWYWHREIGKVVLNGTETGWAVNNSVFYRSFAEKIKGKIGMYSNVFSYKNVAWTSLGNYEMSDDATTTTIFVKDTDYTTIADFKTWLGTNEPSLYFALSTPTNTEITYQPLIDQLNLLEKAMSKEGQTNISQVNNDLPFIISASALKEWQENASLNSTLSMVNPLSLGNTLNTQEIDNNTQPIEVDNIEPLEEEENEES